MSKKEIEPFYINSGMIANWERPVEDGYMRIPNSMTVNAKTEPKKCLGFGRSSGTFREFSYSASASQLLASVAPFDAENEYLEFIDNLQPEGYEEYLKGRMGDAILFSGGIQIYQHGIIPGTSIKGEDLLAQGEIWFAAFPEGHKDIMDKDPDSRLSRIIFNGTSSTQQKAERLHAIALGFKEQKLNKERAESRAASESYRRGAADHHESTFGTFSRRPFRFP